MSLALALQLVLMAVLLLGSGFFSGSETALFGLSRMKRKALERRGEQAAAQVLALLNRPRPLLITILIGNTFVNIALSAVGTGAAMDLVGGERGLGLAIFLVTSMLLVVGEVLPKVMAVRFGESFSLRVAPGLDLFHRAVSPLTRVVEGITHATLRFLPAAESSSLDEGELVTLLKIGEEGGAIASGEAELVEGILALKGTEASEVMTPRVELDALPWDPAPPDAEERIRRLRRQVLPLFGRDLDDLLGVLEVRAYLLAGAGARLQDFVHQPYLIPEGKKLADLLEDFRDRGRTCAVVLDEYGGVSGMITLEDVLEEIFGEVYDRGEREEVEVRRTPAGFRMLGKTLLEEVEETLGLSLEEEEDEEVTTLAGFLMSQLGKLPRRGEVVEFEGWRFEVTHLLRRRVVSVDVTRVHREEAGANP